MTPSTVTSASSAAGLSPGGSAGFAPRRHCAALGRFPVSPFEDALTRLRRPLYAVGLLSVSANLLALALPLYSWQVFDRVIVSRSVDTLLYLSLFAFVALAASGLIELARNHIMARIGFWLERRLGRDVFVRGIELPERDSARPSTQPMRDLTAVRGFIAGPAILAIMDLPWVPLYLTGLFLLHPLLGMIGTAGAAVLIVLAWLGDLVTRRKIQRANMLSQSAQAVTEAVARNGDSLKAMGMLGNVVARWERNQAQILGLQVEASAAGAWIDGARRFARLCLQVLALGCGAWLALQNTLSAGAMIAGTIVLGRALSPIDQIIGSWRSAIAAAGAYSRLKEIFRLLPDRPANMPLPAPEGALTLDSVSFQHPAARVPLLRGVSLSLAPGEALGVIGPTGAGKSTLARLIMGIETPSAGTVRLDGADLARWSRSDLGHHVGYLPQETELLPGTAAENIARMGDVDAPAVVDAAKLAGIHESILALPEGYDTLIGPGGHRLSGGQRQAIALARALYRQPKLVVLDEPNSNLDRTGDHALATALARLREMRVTCIVIAHRPNVLSQVDRVLVLNPGGTHRIGRREDILADVIPLKPNSRAAVRAGSS